MIVSKNIYIKNVLEHDKNEEVPCSAILREVPKRRQVLEGIWKGHPVIVKLYIDSWKARLHFKKEWEKLSLLYKKELNSPEPLFYGPTDLGWQALVMEKITHAQSAYEVWLTCKSADEKRRFMESFVETLAQEHKKGVIQNDLQLDNFLFKDALFYPLDAYQMHFFQKEVTKSHSLDQLALLGSQFKFLGQDFLWNMCLYYEKYRTWSFTVKDREKFFTLLEHYHNLRVKRRIKKFLRSNKRHDVVKSKGTLAVIDRRLTNGVNPYDFVNQIDKLMDTGEIIKRGNTCSLSRLTWNNMDLVVKRYNYQGVFHSIKVTSTRSRARLSWMNAIRLGILNIPTPEPLAFIEKRKGPFIYSSYYITEHVDSDVCGDYLLNERVPEEDKCMVIEKIAAIFETLKDYQISHGDMKNRNILLSHTGPLLIDLDSMKFHRSKKSFIRYWKKDINRFIKNWKHTSFLLNLFLSFTIFNEHIDRVEDGNKSRT